MFLEYDRDMTSVPYSILSIPFVGSFIAFAWLTDSVLWVRDIDKTFYDSVPNIKRAYQEIYDHYHFGGRLVSAIISRNELKPADSDTKALLLFSGGADAHCTFIRNKDKHSLLCNIQGWYDSLVSVNFAADADKRDITKFAEDFNSPFCYVRSNFAKVVNEKYFDKTITPKVGDTWWHGFLHSMAFISIAIPVAYSECISEIMIASSLTIGLNHYCASNSTTDSEFNFARIGFTTHDGFELNRQGKMGVIVGFQRQLSKPYNIRVCSFNDHNCCECEKCFRTVLGIVAEGGDPKDFGFCMDKPLTEHWQSVMDRRAGLMGFGSEKEIHWPHIRRRMKENYATMNDEQKAFVDWFLNFDFDKAKKEGLRRYYRQNFFSILKRKLGM
jgi:hypothetical protein